MILINNEQITLQVAAQNTLMQLHLKATGKKVDITFPSVELDGQLVVLKMLNAVGESVISLGNHITEHIILADTGYKSLQLKLHIRVSEISSIVRFRYELQSKVPVLMTKTNGYESLTYFGVKTSDYTTVNEIRLSEFNEKIHATHLTETNIPSSYFDNQLSLVGPIMAFTDNQTSVVVAYEHGAQYPNAFLNFRLQPDRSISICATKANYATNTVIDRNSSFESIWFQIGVVKGDLDSLAAAYRHFMLYAIQTNTASRQPHIFYNTWGRQERVKWGGSTYNATMRLDYTLTEIDRAAAMGIDVYVIDTGWYARTGDWEVNTEYFPDELKEIKAKLDSYGMKLGLWFNPTMAALSSKTLAVNENSRMTLNGENIKPLEIWETEPSVGLCLVSEYWEIYANKLIDLVDKTGVTYFKLDGVQQYGCNDPRHFHGDANTSPEERNELYAYQLPIYFGKIMEKVKAHCPEAIFDFDITEDGRFVGLLFLSHGKFFIMNNGPYYHNFDVCEEWKSPTVDGNPNIFNHPGAARGWYTRTVLDYDKWIPSVLFLTHYFPDQPRFSQEQNVASLMLGQNGIWGEILPLPAEDVSFFHTQISNYKLVRADVTASTLVKTGEAGDSHEIYEKINPETGRGIVVIFANHKGNYQYITSKSVSANSTVSNPTINVNRGAEGNAIIRIQSSEKGAYIVYFN